jgi:hypothetical protein
MECFSLTTEFRRSDDLGPIRHHAPAMCLHDSRDMQSLEDRPNPGGADPFCECCSRRGTVVALASTDTRGRCKCMSAQSHATAAVFACFPSRLSACAVPILSISLHLRVAI